MSLSARLSAAALAPFIALAGSDAFAEQEDERRARHTVQAVVGHWKTGSDAPRRPLSRTAPRRCLRVRPRSPSRWGVLRDVPPFSGGTFQARFKLVAGRSDQTAGLAFDVRPGAEYLFVRYNTRRATWRCGVSPTANAPEWPPAATACSCRSACGIS